MPIIEVPFIPQKDKNDCLVACMMMIFAWAKDTYVDFAEFKYEEMAQELGWNKDGTPIENVEKLKNHDRIKQHTFQIESYLGWATGMEAIWENIDDGKPLVAHLLQQHNDNLDRHSVLVIGYSDDKTKVFYHDPRKGPHIERPVGEFLDEWEKLHKTNAHIQIVERIDTRIEDYMSDEK